MIIKDIKEQSKLTSAQVDLLGLNNSSTTSLLPDQLALTQGDSGEWWSSYYIGLTEINGHYLEILPKIDDLDFMTLFSYALMYQRSSDYFSSCYSIKWNKEAIACTRLYNILTPLLVIRYLEVLEKLVEKGLKRDYVNINENLHLKIKGKINPISQLRNNTVKKKDDYFFCNYQNYSADIPINRLLKKAFEISINMLGSIRSRCSDVRSLSFISSKLRIQEAFRNIGTNVHPYTIKCKKYDKLNVYYPEAIDLAKSIIRHQENSISSNHLEKKVPPFWIDMSRLFEVYVLGLLETNYPSMILFQQGGSYCTQCDYIHKGEGIILDAKYKPWYSNNKGRMAHSNDLVKDVREISGYARDEKLLAFTRNSSVAPKCVIVYPSSEPTAFSDQLETTIKNNPIEGFHDFYGLGVSLPRISS